MSESGVKEEIVDELDDLTDSDYRHQGMLAASGMLGVDAAAAVGVVGVVGSEEQGDIANSAVTEDGASIIIADSSGPPSDLPVSVNIEVNFQDGNECFFGVYGSCLFSTYCLFFLFVFLRSMSFS